MSENKAPGSPYDIVIIGGGPAGLTAGMYAARADMWTLAIEGASNLSQITATDIIENYPGIPGGVNGFELIERFKTQAVGFGLQNVRQGRSEAGPVRGSKRDGGRRREQRYGALSLVLATGAGPWRRGRRSGRGTLHRPRCSPAPPAMPSRRPETGKRRWSGRGHGNSGGDLSHPFREEGHGDPPARTGCGRRRSSEEGPCRRGKSSS